jgi:hypothetical protein
VAALPRQSRAKEHERKYSLSHLLDKEDMARSSNSSFPDRQDLIDLVGIGEDGPSSRSLDGDDDAIGLEDSDHLLHQGFPVSDLLG